jgi:hypothetical protein
MTWGQEFVLWSFVGIVAGGALMLSNSQLDSEVPENPYASQFFPWLDKLLYSAVPDWGIVMVVRSILLGMALVLGLVYLSPVGPAMRAAIH